MAIKIIPIECPKCNATLNIEADREFAFCSYCGAKVFIHDDHRYKFEHTHEHHIIDESKKVWADAAKSYIDGRNERLRRRLNPTKEERAQDTKEFFIAMSILLFMLILLIAPLVFLINK